MEDLVSVCDATVDQHHQPPYTRYSPGQSRFHCRAHRQRPSSGRAIPEHRRSAKPFSDYTSSISAVKEPELCAHAATVSR